MNLNEVLLSGGTATAYLNNGRAAAIMWHAYAVCAHCTSTGSSVKSAAELAK